MLGFTHNYIKEAPGSIKYSLCFLLKLQCWVAQGMEPRSHCWDLEPITCRNPYFQYNLELGNGKIKEKNISELFTQLPYIDNFKMLI